MVRSQALDWVVDAVAPPAGGEVGEVGRVGGSRGRVRAVAEVQR